MSNQPDRWTVRAVVVHGAGDLRVEELPDPSPGPGEALVRLEWGGICGSDLSYWRHGATGTAVLREPLILGHEVSGRVVALGSGRRAQTDRADPPNRPSVRVGDPVTVHPATPGPSPLPDRLAGRTNLDPGLRYFGSAAHSPHTPGGFSTLRAVPIAQLRVLPVGLDTRRAAVAEPLAVALHALARAGEVRDRAVLVNGCGPIGALIIAAARAAGAGRILAADVADFPLQLARRLGADRLINRAGPIRRSNDGARQTSPDGAAGESDTVASGALPDEDDPGAGVEVAFEVSGVPAAIAGVFAATGRGGVVVQVGNLPTGPHPADLAAIVTRELDYRGSYRFVEELDRAIALLAGGLDVEPILTHTFGLADAEQAFVTAAGPAGSKVLLDFTA